MNTIIEDMFSQIPPDVVAVFQTEIAFTEIHVLQRPADKAMGNGHYYAHIHNQDFGDCLNVHFYVEEQGTAQASIANNLFHIFLNYLMQTREENGSTIQ